MNSKKWLRLSRKRLESWSRNAQVKLSCRRKPRDSKRSMSWRNSEANSMLATIRSKYSGHMKRLWALNPPKFLSCNCSWRSTQGEKRSGRAGTTSLNRRTLGTLKISARWMQKLSSRSCRSLTRTTTRWKWRWEKTKLMKCSTNFSKTLKRLIRKRIWLWLSARKPCSIVTGRKCSTYLTTKWVV